MKYCSGALVKNAQLTQTLYKIASYGELKHHNKMQKITYPIWKIKHSGECGMSYVIATYKI